MNNPPDFICQFDRQFEDGLSFSNSLCRAAPSPKKNSENGCLWGRGRLYTAFRAANAFWFTVRASFFSQIRHRNALTEIAWGDAVQGLGMAMSLAASEKNRKLLFIISACFFTSISRARPPESCKYQSPAKSQIFAMEKISSPRERRKWSLGLSYIKGLA